MNAAAYAQALLMYVAMPLWVAAGLADWACHRATRIERTAGLPENLVHWLLFFEIGGAMLAVAFLDITAPVLLLVGGAFVVHEVAVWLELRYVVARREVRPVEQVVHSFMELLPLASLLLLVVVAHEQGTLGDMALRLKAEPWPPAYLLCTAAAIALFDALPLAEETMRCLRARRAAA